MQHAKECDQSPCSIAYCDKVKKQLLEQANRRRERQAAILQRRAQRMTMSNNPEQPASPQVQNPPTPQQQQQQQINQPEQIPSKNMSNVQHQQQPPIQNGYFSGKPAAMQGYRGFPQPIYNQPYPNYGHFILKHPQLF